MKKRIINRLIFFAIIVNLYSCIEPFNIDNIGVEKVIVIQASITDEFKYHTIKLSETVAINDTLNNNGISGAKIKVIENQQKIYTFKEISNGVYLSEEEFKAIIGKKYVLDIETKKGEKYQSSAEEIIKKSSLTGIKVKKVLNDKKTSLNILVEGKNNGTKDYYRYEFEETYKIIPPKWYALDLVMSPNEPNSLIEVPRNPNTRICYNTVMSKEILIYQSDIQGQEGNWEFIVKSISKNNPILSHRYSIKIKQFSQSSEANNYFKKLNSFSKNENLLSENQAGFFKGNIKSIQNPNKKVVGFFEVASVDSKRIFLNRLDYFPNEDLPEYFINCESSFPEFPAEIIRIIDTTKLRYFGDNPHNPRLHRFHGPFAMVKAGCGDCTKLGTNIKPKFWIE